MNLPRLLLRRVPTSLKRACEYIECALIKKLWSKIHKYVYSLVKIKKKINTLIKHQLNQLYLSII